MFTFENHLKSTHTIFMCAKEQMTRRLSKKVTMCACSGQCQNKNISFNFVNQEPIWSNVTFPVIYPISRQKMVFAFWGKLITFGEYFNNLAEFAINSLSSISTVILSDAVI